MMNVDILPQQKTNIMKLGLIALLFLILYSPTFQMFIYDWSNDDNYSHGFLVPFIVGYLVWTKRDELRKRVPTPSLWGLVVLVLGLGMYVVGTVGAEWFVRRTSLIVVLAGLILYLGGKDYLRVLLFPLVFLLFMIPLPAIIYTAIAFKLQIMVSVVSAELIALAGVSIYRVGNILEVSSGPLSVEEACSGMRSIMALLALSSLLRIFKNRMTPRGVHIVNKVWFPIERLC
jgi:exosortase